MEQNNPVFDSPKTENSPSELNNNLNHCNRCHSKVLFDYYFCPYCGHKIKEPPYHFSLISTLSILLISFLFPPFGLIPAFKFLKNENPKAKFIGILAILVTIISFIIFILIIREYVNTLNKTINSINSIYYY